MKQDLHFKANMTNEILIVKINEIYGRIVAPDWKIMGTLCNKFAIWVPIAKFDRRYKSGQWDGKIHFVHKDGTFPIGLLSNIYNYLKSQSEYTVEVDPELNKQTMTKKEFSKDFLDVTKKTFLPNCKYVPRAHQIKGAIKSLYAQRSICEHCTGSGKSLVIALVANYLMKTNPESQILILVPTLDLIEQFTEDMIDYGVSEYDLGKFNGKQKDFDSNIVISTWQSAYRYPDFLKQFTSILVDECHGLKADVIRGVSEGAENATIRLGFTGTMPDEISEKMRIYSTLGPVVDIIKQKELEKLGQISKIKITVPYLMYSKQTTKIMRESAKLKKLKDPIAAYNFERDFVQNSCERNQFITNIVKKKISIGHNVLILVNKHIHVDAIVSSLEKNNITPIVVTGKIKNMDERNEKRALLEKTGGQVLVATSGVFSTGISIKRLHCVIFADASKSKIKTLQSVGRGLRQHESKERLHLIDIADNFKYGKDHLQKRLEFYANNDFEVEVKEIQLGA